MKPKIFITPWIELGPKDIDILIDSGANSARINTGKLINNIAKIHELIKYYKSRDFKFYFDLTGNKPRAEKITHKTSSNIEIGDEVIISSHISRNVPKSINHNLISTYIPTLLKNINSGDLNVDDGNLIFDIKKVVLLGNKINYLITKVILNTQKQVHIQDGISSSNLYIHSGYKNLLTKSDIEILSNISNRLKRSIKYIVLSFCENPKQIIESINYIKSIGYDNFQVVPKIETVIGINNIDKICKLLIKIYGKKAELQIGRGDLSLDAKRGRIQYDYNLLVDNSIKTCSVNKVLISVLALVMQSSRKKFKHNRNTKDIEPSIEDVNNINHLCDKKVYQIGLTNDMYIDKPERMVSILANIIKTHKLKSPIV